MPKRDVVGASVVVEGLKDPKSDEEELGRSFPASLGSVTLSVDGAGVADVKLLGLLPKVMGVVAALKVKSPGPLAGAGVFAGSSSGAASLTGDAARDVCSMDVSRRGCPSDPNE